MIHLNCPGCGVKLKAADEAAGQQMACPKCGTTLTVSEPVFDAEAISDPIATPGDVYGLDEPAPTAGGPAPAGDDRRPCPVCGEMIVATAAKCRYCGEIFDPTLRRAESLKQGRSQSPADQDLSTGDWVVAILCSFIGCIAGIVWMIQGKPKGAKMFGISLVFTILWNVLRFLIESANTR
jgi:predicted RNA-binding Zn-ribbon protein involved in translation (DUF1610 family)